MDSNVGTRTFGYVPPVKPPIRLLILGVYAKKVVPKFLLGEDIEV